MEVSKMSIIDVIRNHRKFDKNRNKKRKMKI